MKNSVYLVLSWLVATSALASSQNAEEDVFGLFKGLHEPFLNTEHPEFSPLHGLDRTLVESVRMNAHQGPENKGFARPKSRSIDPECFPQTAFSAFLERLFTSHVGLMPNSDSQDPIHKWLRPSNIALVFNLLAMNGFYEWPLAQSSLCLAEAFMPDTFDQMIRKARKQNHAPSLAGKFMDLVIHSRQQNQNLQRLEAFLNKQGGLKAVISFADLIARALHETHGHKAIDLGMPEHIVPSTLLCFMWETKKAKADLIPFYDVLSDTIIDKEAVKRIIWQGEGSYYTEQDYWSAKRMTGKLPLELSRLLRLGYARFEDRLPPEIYYGVSHVKHLGEVLSFSDCGETTLRYLLMALIYDPDKRIYDWTRLSNLRKQGIMVLDEIIEYFRDICTGPAVADTPYARNRWAVIMGLINHQGDPDPVKMLHGDGKFGIDAGLHNILKGLGALLLDPLWDKPIDPRKPALHKLNRLCSMFSPSRLLPGSEAPWEWEIASLSPADVGPNTEIMPSQKLRDSFNTTVIFKLSGYHVYEWHIQPKHFDFNRASPIYYGAEAELASKAFAIPHNMSEEAFPRYLYNADLRSLRGRLIALNRIFWFKNTHHKSTYDSLLCKWFEPTGKYFGYYGDFHSNELLLTILLRGGKTVDEVLAMNIPKLAANLFWMKARAKDNDSLGAILKLDLEMFEVEGKPYHDLDFLRMARVASVAMLKASKEDFMVMLKAGLDKYIEYVAGRTLFSLVIFTGNGDVIRAFAQLALEGSVKITNEENPQEMVRQLFGRLDEQALIEPLEYLLKMGMKKLAEEESFDDDNPCKLQ